MTDLAPDVTARTFAIGDLHGEITLLRRLLECLQPTHADTLVFLGDYIDRGEDSVAVCEELLRLQEQEAMGTGPHIIALRGNHDAAWLEVWTGSGHRERPPIPGARAIWERYQGMPPLSIGRFLETTSLTYEDANGFYCHAGISPERSPQDAGEEVWLWGSGGFTLSVHHATPIVCGHYELKEPLVTPERICLDIAAYRTGVLTAMRMETRELIQVSQVNRPSARST